MREEGEEIGDGVREYLVGLMGAWGGFEGFLAVLGGSERTILSLRAVQ